MAVKTIRDEINEVDLTVVEGVVAQIFVKQNDAPDQYGNTHKIGVRIDNDWVNNINVKVKEGFEPQVRFNAGNKSNPDWQNLEVGDEVKMVVSTSEWNGKTTYHGKVSQIKLIKKGAGAPAKPQGQAGGQGQKAQEYDATGIETGHAINAAFNFMTEVDFDNPVQIVEVAKQFHTLTMKLKTEYAEANPKVSKKDVGATVGHAVLNAAKYSSTMEEVEEIANSILANVSSVVGEFVKSDAKSATKPAAKAAAKKATKAAPKKEVTPEIEDDDIGDDIPF